MPGASAFVRVAAAALLVSGCSSAPVSRPGPIPTASVPPSPGPTPSAVVVGEERPVEVTEPQQGLPTRDGGVRRWVDIPIAVDDNGQLVTGSLP